MKSSVNIVEVGPRDGLQNESMLVPTPTKIELIHHLAASGLKTIEATSFVSREQIPQLTDASEVMNALQDISGVDFPVLVPNLKGFNEALAAGAKHVAIFASATESFSKHNIHCSIAESMTRFEEIMPAAKTQDIPVRGYVSCIAGCPYEGKVNVDAVLAVARQLYNLGCYEISLGDTIGVGTAAQIQTIIKTISTEIPTKQLAVHFHNTYGQALANTYAALELGVQTIDSSIAGLGGCPYAPGAAGNLSTEDVVYMLHGLGIKTDIDLEQLITAGQFICKQLNRPNHSAVANAIHCQSS